MDLDRGFPSCFRISHLNARLLPESVDKAAILAHPERGTAFLTPRVMSKKEVFRMPSAQERFREILHRTVCTPAAPVFDPLSARIADMQGWQICKLSGSFGKFANLAVPDGISLANMSDLADACWRINRVSDACLIVDADDGGGNALNVARTVRELEAAGACAIEIQDNAPPTVFGQAERRHALMLSEEEQVGKLEAAVAARRNSDTVIVARTSVLSELPRNDALKRIRAYSKTGAEALMFPEIPRGKEDLLDIAASTDLPLMVLGVPSDLLKDEAFLQSVRLRIRFLPHLPYRMALRAIADALMALKQGDEIADLMARRAASEDSMRELDRTAEMREWQNRYVRKA